MNLINLTTLWMLIFVCVNKYCWNIYKNIKVSLKCFVCFSQPSGRSVKLPGVFMARRGGKWTVNSILGVVNVTLLLQTEQPSVLEINIPKNKPTPMELRELCKVITEKFTGSLILKLCYSFLQYVDYSDIFKILSSSR